MSCSISEEMEIIVKTADLMEACYWLRNYGADPVAERACDGIERILDCHIERVVDLKLWRKFREVVIEVGVELVSDPHMLDDFDEV